MTLLSPPPRLETVVAAHVDLVYAAALRQVRDPHLADDVTQAVFLVLARKADRLPPEPQLAAWLVKVTRYTALTALRADRRHRRHETAAGLARPAAAPAESDEDRLSALLDEALMALAESDRELIVLRYLQRRPLPEVATLLRVQTNTAAKRVERALDRLRRLLGRRGVSEAALGAALPALGLRPAPSHLTSAVVHACAGSLPPAAGGVPLRILLMTASTKLKIAAVAALAVLLAAGGTAVYLATPAGAPAPAGAAPAPAAAPAQSDRVMLTGNVRDAQGNPVAGALVTQGYSPALSEGYFKTRTSADGSFALSASRGKELLLSVQAPGCSPELITGGLLLEDPKPFAVTLSPGHTLRVKFVDARGKPIPDLAVEPQSWRDTEVLRTFKWGGPGNWNGPTTDADGLLTWTDAPADAVLYDPILLEKYLRKRVKLAATGDVQTVTVADAVSVQARVEDAQTGAAIPAFKVVRGFGDNGDAPYNWRDDAPTQGSNGVFTHTITWWDAYCFLRVEAPGYRPQVQSFAEDKADVRLTFKLAKATTQTVTILRPDGKPATGAVVYVVPPERNFSLQETEVFRDPRMPPSPGNMLLTADAAGSIALPDGQPVGTRVVIVDDAGFATVPIAETTAPVHLAGWARLEGTARVGPQVAAGRQVTLFMTVAQGPPMVYGNFTTTADGQGRFAFDRLPPGTAGVGLWVESNVGTRFASGTAAATVPVTLKGGEVTAVTVGGTGRAVVGHVAAADGTPAPRNWIYGLGEVRTDLPRPPEFAALSEHLAAWQKLAQADAEAAMKAWNASPEGMAYQRAHDSWFAAQRRYAFAVAPDGTFRVDDLPPGPYRLTLRILENPAGTLAGEATAAFTIPDPATQPATRPAGRGPAGDEPLDLGAVRLTPSAGK
jgi:RNA polymerase sigma factor (sigma-70 family)